MDEKSKAVLDHVDEKTQHIIIYNDKTFVRKDVEELVRVITGCRTLKSLTITGCDLLSSKFVLFDQAILLHPALEKIDIQDGDSNVLITRSGGHTQDIVIKKDSTIDVAECITISNAIKDCRKLQSFVFTECEAGDGVLEKLIEPLAVHPSIDLVDFSGNKASSLLFAEKLIRTNKKLRTFCIRSNAVELGDADYKQFLSILATCDTLASITLPLPASSGSSDTSMGLGWQWREYTDFFTPFKNLIQIDFPTLTKVYTEETDRICDCNRDRASTLLEKVRSKRISKLQEVQQLNERVPAVIVVGTEYYGSRAKILTKLRELNEYLIDTMGTAIGLEMYTTAEDEALDSRFPALITTEPKVIEPTTSSSLPTIQEVVKNTPILSEDAIRQKIIEGRDNPVLLSGLAQEVIGMVSDIALASLNAATSPTSAEMPLRSMADFLEKLAEAKGIVKEQSKQAQSVEPAVKAPVITQKKNGRKWWLFREDEEKEPDATPAETLRTLAHAGDLTRQAGQVLSDMVPSLAGMEGELAGQIGTTRRIITAYQLVGSQICLTRKVGQAELAVWKQEDAQTLDQDNSFSVLGNEGLPFHIQALESRLEFLETMEVQITGHISNHVLLATVAQNQQLSMAQIRGQNIPLMLESAATFMQQVTALQRSGVINGMAATTREATRAEGDTHMLAAMNTLAALENLAESTTEALAHMSEQTERMTAGTGHDKSREISAPPPIAKDRLGRGSSTQITADVQ